MWKEAGEVECGWFREAGPKRFVKSCVAFIDTGVGIVKLKCERVILRQTVAHLLSVLSTLIQRDSFDGWMHFPLGPEEPFLSHKRLRKEKRISTRGYTHI